MPKFIDLAGQKFNRWTVISRIGTVYPTRWLCRCDCGTEREVHASSLRNGKSASCGCFHSERMVEVHTKHGFAGRGDEAPEYNIWSDMIQRCHCETNKAFYNYGDRGIYVCDLWRMSFVDFLRDVGPRLEAKLTIERIDNNRGYTCGHCESCIAKGDTANCRWATRAEQAKNRRSNHFLTHDGVTLHVTEWSRRIGRSVACILGRLKKGLPMDQILSATHLHRQS